MKTLYYNDIPITLHQAGFLSSLRLSVNARGKIRLSAPIFVSQKKALQFIESNWDWIAEQLAKITPTACFTPNQQLTICGHDYTLCHVPDARRGVWAEGNQLYVSGTSDSFHRRVKDYIKKQTYADLQQTALRMAQQLGKQINKITLKDTSSRWGSCSAQHNLNFCWKLGLAPDFVREYLVAHEVSHLCHMNHSAAFWKTVNTLTDTQSRAEIWLRRNGNKLQAWK